MSYRNRQEQERCTFMASKQLVLKFVPDIEHPRNRTRSNYLKDLRRPQKVSIFATTSSSCCCVHDNFGIVRCIGQESSYVPDQNDNAGSLIWMKVLGITSQWIGCLKKNHGVYCPMTNDMAWIIKASGEEGLGSFYCIMAAHSNSANLGVLQ